MHERKNVRHALPHCQNQNEIRRNKYSACSEQLKRCDRDQRTNWLCACGLFGAPFGGRLTNRRRKKNMRMSRKYFANLTMPNQRKNAGGYIMAVYKLMLRLDLFCIAEYIVFELDAHTHAQSLCTHIIAPPNPFKRSTITVHVGRGGEYTQCHYGYAICVVRDD